MLVHINNKLSCPKKSCDKQFKSIGNLNRHINSHSKGGWYHCDHCDYKNKDKHNTDLDMRTHSTEDESRYECDKCGKKMHFSSQLGIWHMFAFPHDIWERSYSLSVYVVEYTT